MIFRVLGCALFHVIDLLDWHTQRKVRSEIRVVPVDQMR